jgi:hypothetical protein
LVYRYFLREGWLPPDTTDQNWDAVTMGQMLFDDPPLVADPDFQKRRISLDIQALFFALGRTLADCLPQLKNRALTLADFAGW